MSNVFSRWMLLFLLMLMGFLAMAYFGIWHLMWFADISKISFGILTLFLLLSLHVGYMTHRASKTKFLSKKIDIPNWFAERFTMLGILGTGIGIMFMMFTTNFSGETKEVINQVLFGLGTALITTVTGIVCCYLLELQIFNVRRTYNENKQSCCSN